ncbi:hypothetical protein BFW88_16920 [Pseudomonas fluorescens]|nr:hypothetical protein BFW88_16920 [Pseudomonas fluorescens]OPB07756.1 hypothetical protein BFW92_16845 [Pseudomonas fluorescens]OPB19028.1 hypothetical protein BFW93_16875 [Pseudomonas fluorescens]
MLKVESRSPLALAVFDHGMSYDLSLPTAFMREIEGVYDEVHIEDLTGDGVGEVVFRLTGEGVNTCSRVLYYESSDRSLSELVFKKGGLCNIKIRNGYVVSSYKKGAAWIEDVYVVGAAKVKIQISDSCVGCGEVTRTEYRSDHSSLTFLVSDDLDFEKRVALSANVISSQAKIYSFPRLDQATEKKLVKGDKITLLGFDTVHGDDWVEFRYSGETIVEGWLKCSDLDGCN